MALYLLVLLFIFGLAFGSFLNVVIFRFEPGRFVFSLESLSGRSECPHCDKDLKWFELIPLLSFLIQQGKCRGCGESLSLQYPVVEFVSGLLFAAVPAYLFSFYQVGTLPVNLTYFSFLATLWVLSFLILVLVEEIDRQHYLIPNELNVTLAGLGGLVMIFKYLISSSVLPFHNSFLQQYALISSPFRSVLANHILGALVGLAFFLFLILASRGKAMGWGDVKFVFGAGLLMGWPDIGLSLAIAFVVGGLVGLVAIMTERKSMEGKLPFAPFLILGMVVTFFFGFPIVHNYLVFLGL